jgi:nucleotide-binding universal stress UspA family protein
MTGLRRTAGLPAALTRSRFGAAPWELAPAATERWREHGLVEIACDALVMTSDGRWLLDSFLLDIAGELADDGSRGRARA